MMALTIPQQHERQVFLYSVVKIRQSQCHFRAGRHFGNQLPWGLVTKRRSNWQFWSVTKILIDI